MPFLDFGDDPEEFELKFDDCAFCANFGRLRICNGCEVGEEFVEKEPDGVDVLFDS